MKKAAELILIIFAGILLPGIFTMLFTGRKDGMQKQMGIKVVLEDGREIDGEQYVMGMAACEIPRLKEEEALKAWMIICRTNFLKAAGSEKSIEKEKLPFDYISQEQMELNNGKKISLEYQSRLMEASEETFGNSLFYGNERIDALYHQVSPGKTTSSKEIYAIDVPYLSSVDSSQDVESGEYMNLKIITWEDLTKKLKLEEEKDPVTVCKDNLKIEDQTENGYVKTVSIKKNKWTGEEWKELFELSSPYFYFENYEERLRMISLGKGHGMGLSLYGANAMAEKGKKAEEILAFYYPGTKLRNPGDKKEVNRDNAEKTEEKAVQEEGTGRKWLFSF